MLADGQCEFKARTRWILSIQGIQRPGGDRKLVWTRGPRGFLRKIVWIFSLWWIQLFALLPIKCVRKYVFPYSISLYILLGRMHPSIEYSLKVGLQHKQWLPTGYLPLGVNIMQIPVLFCFFVWIRFDTCLFLMNFSTVTSGWKIHILIPHTHPHSNLLSLSFRNSYY